MSEQTENYIILKPIAERFNKIAQEITDEEIKGLIKSGIRDQIKNAFDFSNINEIVEDYIDNHQDDILKMISEAICHRLRFQ